MRPSLACPSCWLLTTSPPHPPGLPEDLELHHIVVNDWGKGVDAPQNVVLISIASVVDPSMAPEGGGMGGCVVECVVASVM